jgi:hypothetical protein
VSMRDLGLFSIFCSPLSCSLILSSPFILPLLLPSCPSSPPPLPPSLSYLSPPQVVVVKEFIALNQTTLVEFNRHRYKCSVLSTLKGTENFLSASVTAGVALALREVPLPSPPPPSLSLTSVSHFTEELKMLSPHTLPSSMPLSPLSLNLFVLGFFKMSLHLSPLWPQKLVS